MPDNWEIVADDSPERCQAHFSKGFQCHARRAPNSEFCIRHQGGGLVQQKRQMKLYHLAKYQARFEEQINHPSLKTLNQEVGILRMTLENIVNQCQDDKTLLLFSKQISDMVSKIRDVVLSCHRLEMATGQMLDKNQVITLGEQIVSIIASHVENPEIVEVIAEEIALAVENTAFVSFKEHENKQLD